jgi:hypothetical protein
VASSEEQNVATQVMGPAVVELVPVYVMLPGGTELSVAPVAEVKVKATLALPPRASDRTLSVAPVAIDPDVQLVLGTIRLASFAVGTCRGSGILARQLEHLEALGVQLHLAR